MAGYLNPPEGGLSSYFAAKLLRSPRRISSDVVVASSLSGMFGGQRAARAIVPVFQAMPLLPELVLVQNGFNYRHGAPDGAFACSIPP